VSVWGSADQNAIMQVTLAISARSISWSASVWY
jgi:hypothetical protein